MGRDMTGKDDTGLHCCFSNWVSINIL